MANNNNSKRPVPSIIGLPKTFSNKFRVVTEIRSETGFAASNVVALDGSGDFDNIQAAIDALPPEGGEVLIKPGNYNISSTIDIDKSDVIIRGSGFNTNITTSASIIVFRIGRNAVANRVLISNLLITGSGAGSQWGIVWTNGIDGRVLLCKINGVGTNAINIEHKGSSGHIISNNTLVNCGNNGITVSEANDCLIENNLIQDNIDTGIVISNFLDISERNILKSNIITGNDKGISIKSPNLDTLIIGNIVKNNTTNNIIDNGTDTQMAHNITGASFEDHSGMAMLGRIVTK